MGLYTGDGRKTYDLAVSLFYLVETLVTAIWLTLTVNRLLNRFFSLVSKE